MQARTYLVRHTPLGVASIDKPEPKTFLGKMEEALLRLHGWARCTAAEIDAGSLPVHGPAGEELKRSKASGMGIAKLDKDLPPPDIHRYVGGPRPPLRFT